MDKTIKVSNLAQGKYGIVGHVGVGHVHSHQGFVQDDSAGFAVVATLLEKAVNIDLTISAINVDLEKSSITVTTSAGGKGTVSARRGFTPCEKELAQRAVGMDAAFTQNVAVNTFGRIYGQGVLEVPVALQGACALAVMSSFKKVLGDKLFVTEEKFPNKYDVFAGLVLEIDSLPISVMMVINGTNGGIGPDEDLEGNTNYGDKGKLMAKIGLDKIPTMVVESKAYIPSMAPTVKENQFMVRAQKDLDCTELGRAVYEEGLEKKIPIRFEDSIMALIPGTLEKGTQDFADKVIATAQKLRGTDLSKEKTALVAELAKLVSEDAGGVTFMSNSVHDKMRGAGTLPKITAVLSMVTTTEYQKYWKIPQVEQKEAEEYVELLIGGIKRFAKLGK